MNLKRENIRFLIVSLFKNNSKPEEIQIYISNTWPGSEYSVSQIYRIIAEYQKGNMQSFEDKKRPGRPITVTTEENIQRVEEAVTEDPKLTLR
jgi:hypothetical protein